MQLRTISRAILTVIMASAFLAMSIAGGLHEMSHLGRHSHAIAGSTSGATAGAAGDRSHGMSIDQGNGLAASSAIGEFCFFCTFGSSIVHTATPIRFEPAYTTIAARAIPGAPDLRTHRSILPSLRAPPVLA